MEIVVFFSNTWKKKKKKNILLCCSVRYELGSLRKEPNITLHKLDRVSSTLAISNTAAYVITI